MKWPTVLITILWLTSCSNFKKLPKRPLPLREQINHFIQERNTLHPSSESAMLVSIIQKDETQLLRFPEDSITYKMLPDIDSKFVIGGLSQVLMIALLQQLDDKGLLNLSRIFNEMLPKGRGNPYFNDLTVKDLINHQTGFPKLPNNLGQKDNGHPYRTYSKLDLLQFYQSLPPTQNRSFLYSHINYALLEIGLEHHFKTTLSSLLNKYVFQPLRMDNSFVLDDTSSLSAIYPGFQRNGEACSLATFRSYGGALGIVTTMRDLNAFVRSCLTTKEYIFTDSRLSSTAYAAHIRMQGGWYLVREEGKSYYMHAGRSDGHYAYIALSMEDHKAVIILSNSAKGVDMLGIDIIRSL